jgi:hypothetical protein
LEKHGRPVKALIDLEVQSDGKEAIFVDDVDARE